MTPRHHSDWIASYVATVSPKSEAPERFAFWTAVSTIAGALRRRVYLDMGSFKWFPNFFIVLVGPPGTVKKSTTIDVGLKLLREIPGINFGADCTTWQSFITEVENAKDIFACGDAPELTLDEEHSVSSALTLAISEWGTFLDPRNREMIEVLTEFWDCKDGAWRKATKTQGDNTIVAPFVNMIAGTTDAWMRMNFHAQFGGWGFSSRCIFLYSSKAERSIAYPDEVWGEDMNVWQKPFVADLEVISRMQGAYSLDRAARDYGRAWYNDHHHPRLESFNEHPDHDPWVGYYLARKQTHAHKLALILAASRRSQLIITEADLTDAITRCDEVEGEIGKIFGSGAAVSREAKLATDVMEAIGTMIRKNNGGIPRKAAIRFALRYMVYPQAKSLIDGYIATGLLKQEEDAEGVWLTLSTPGQLAG